MHKRHAPFSCSHAAGWLWQPQAQTDSSPLQRSISSQCCCCVPHHNQSMLLLLPPLPLLLFPNGSKCLVATPETHIGCSARVLPGITPVSHDKLPSHRLWSNQCHSCSTCLAACCLAPSLHLHHLQAVHVRVAEEDSRAARHAHGVRDAGCTQPLHQGLDALHTNACVAVTAPMLRAAIKGVRVWQLHEVNHLRADPQPCTTVRKLVVGAIRVDLQAENVLVEVQSSVQVLAEQADMMHPPESNPSWCNLVCSAVKRG
mmetsp:Transcript_34393/g.76388  ORF Transcript_34393/g.76388 Transcript_34393/m.76388 type:complete len:258 (-) Transcript_34393:315-1088(-)